MSYLQPFANIIIASELSDFPEPSASVITVSSGTTVFLNAQDVQLGANRLVLGDNCVITGFSPAVAGMSSTTTGSLITFDNAGELELKNIKLSCTNGKVVDVNLNSTGTFIINDCVIDDCVTIATITNPNISIIQADCFNFTNGITYVGASGIEIEINNSVFTDFTGTAVDLGTFTTPVSLLIDNVWDSNNSGSIDISGLVSSGNITSGGVCNVTDCEFSNVGTVGAIPLENITTGDIRWHFRGTNLLNSTVSAEVCVTDNVLVTTIPALGATVIANITGVNTDEVNRLSVDTTGFITFLPEIDKIVTFDGNISMDPDNGTRDLAASFCTIHTEQIVVTFTNGTNIINETATTLANNDRVTFFDNAGTLPTELLDTVIYHVVNKATDSFQVAYTEGGSAITFSTDGSGTNSYKETQVHGSFPSLPIASNNPRNVVPQSLHRLVNGYKTLVVIKNKDSAVDIVVNPLYYRVKL